MSAFTLSLPDGSKVSGKSFTPTKLQGPASRRPLFVAMPGGTYTTDFFNADANHSIQQWSEALGIPAIGLNRPGNDVIPAPTDMDKESNTFIQKSGSGLTKSRYLQFGTSLRNKRQTELTHLGETVDMA